MPNLEQGVQHVLELYDKKIDEHLKEMTETRLKLTSCLERRDLLIRRYLTDGTLEDVEL